LKTPNFVTALSGVALATSGIVFGLCLPSSAAELWDWSYDGGGSQGGSGTFTTTFGPGYLNLITGITGTVETEQITSLLQPGDFGGNDNFLLFGLANPQLTFWGVSFASATATNYNLRYAGNSTTEYVLSGLWGSYSPVNFKAELRLCCSAPTTPEPSMLLSFITLGGLMLGGAVRGARK
jgi:hypothetical protein